MEESERFDLKKIVQMNFNWFMLVYKWMFDKSIIGMKTSLKLKGNYKWGL